MGSINSIAWRQLSRPGPTLTDRQGLVSAVGGLVAAACIGAVTVFSPQGALSLVLLVAVVALWSRSRTAGVAAVWLLWLVLPGIRRLFVLVDSYPDTDPLSLVPFVATGAVALLELTRTDMSHRAKRVLGLAALGFMLGLPAAISNPTAGIFAAAAYGSGLAAYVIGYGERGDGTSSFSLRRVLLTAGPLLAVYGILQYFLPLSAWDSFWVENVDFGAIDAPTADGHIRVFASLNAPQPLATVLAVALLFFIAMRRLSAGVLVLSGLVALALSLTYARSAQVALVGGLLALGFATRGRAIPRVLGIVVGCVAAVVLLSPVSPTASAILERATSFGSLGEDESTEVRTERVTELMPVALTTPLGHGLGSTGEPAKLGGSSGEARFLGVDNAYLSVAWQTGPLGFLLIIGALLWVLAITVRSRVSERARLELKVLLVSSLALLLVYAAGHDIFYGVSGAIFWYLLGKAMRLADERIPPRAVPARAFHPKMKGASRNQAYLYD